MFSGSCFIYNWPHRLSQLSADDTYRIGIWFAIGGRVRRAWQHRRGATIRMLTWRAMLWCTMSSSQGPIVEYFQAIGTTYKWILRILDQNVISGSLLRSHRIVLRTVDHPAAWIFRVVVMAYIVTVNVVWIKCLGYLIELSQPCWRGSDNKRCLSIGNKVADKHH